MRRTRSRTRCSCQGRYEDAIALALESIQIDLSIGGRFQLAKTLTNIGQSYGKVGDLPRALAYLKRARDAHERYGDQDGRADTLITTLRSRSTRGTSTLCRPAPRRRRGPQRRDGQPLRLDLRARRARGAVARRAGEPTSAVAYASEARREAEGQALVSFQFYALAIEVGGARDAGEIHAGRSARDDRARRRSRTCRAASTGSRFASLCADVLARADSPQAAQAQERAIEPRDAPS